MGERLNEIRRCLGALPPPRRPDSPFLELRAALPCPSPGRGPVQRERTTGQAGRILAVTALVTVIVGAAALAGVVTDRPRTVAPSTSQPETIHNETDLTVRPGHAYDLDVRPGQPMEIAVGASPARADLYRTRDGADQLQGWPSPTGAYNSFSLVDDDTDVFDCPALSPQGGGNVKVTELGPGRRICVETHDRRWALLTVDRMPATRLVPLRVHVTVLAADG